LSKHQYGGAKPHKTSLHGQVISRFRHPLSDLGASLAITGALVKSRRRC
jgi:hypothetical protein